MSYLQPEIKNAYTPYLSISDNPEVGMDVGLLVLDEGQEYSGSTGKLETAFLLLEGRAQIFWAGREAEISRKNPFLEEASCLHLSCGETYRIKALGHCEVYVQSALNEKPFASKLYLPRDVQVQHAGDKNELQGAMRREIKTFFDDDNAPFSQMVLGEVLNLPGKWSSYPPHHHPQPEVYFHRFDRPLGFGASFANGEVYTSRNNGLTVITDGFHSQVAAPGYAMCYVWGIRHLPGNRWLKTRIDDPGHEWLWKPDANDHIFTLEKQS